MEIDKNQVSAFAERMRAAENESLSWTGRAGDVAQGAFAGAVDAVEETAQFAHWAADGLAEGAGYVMGQDWEGFEDNPDRFLFNPARPSTALGRGVKDISQFATGFVGAGKFKLIGNVGSKIFKEGSKKAAITSSAAKSATSSVVAHDPYEERLSDILVQYPATTNAVTEYLASDEDDTEAERRLKMGLEDLALTGVLEGVFWAARAVKKGGKAVEEADENLKNIDKKADATEAKNTAEKRQVIAEATAQKETIEAVVKQGGDPESLPRDKILETVINDLEALAKESKTTRDTVIDGLSKPNIVELGKVLGVKIGQNTKLKTVKKRIKKVLDDAREGQKVNSVNKAVPKVDIPTKATPDQIQAILKGIKTPEDMQAVFSGTKRGTFKLFNRTEDGDISIMPDDFPDEVTAVIQQTINASKPMLDQVKGTLSVDDVNKAVAERLSETSDLTAKQWMDTAFLHASNVDEAMITLHSIESMLTESLERVHKLFSNELYESNAEWQAKAHAEVETFNNLLSGSQKLESVSGRALRMRQEKIFDSKGVAKAIRFDSKSAAEAIVDLGGEKSLAEFRTLVLASGGDLGKIGKKAAKLPKGNKLTAPLGELFRGMILFNIKTHVTNIASGITESVIVPMERYMGSYIPYGRNPFGVEAKRVRQDTVYHLMGMSSAFKDSIALAASSFRAEKNFLDPANTKLDGGDVQNKISSGFAGIRGDTTTGRFLDTIGKVSRGSLRALGSEDEFFKQINYRGRVFAGAMREAMALMDAGTLKSTKEVKEYALKKVTEAFDDAGKGTNTGALQYAREVTFTEELRQGSKALDLQRATQNHPSLQLFLPFVRTPTNLIVRAVQRTPLLHLMSKTMKETLANGTPEEIAQMHGRVALGTTFIGGIYFSTLEGKITGAGPAGVDQNRLWRAAGNQPYSIRVGDSWVSYNRADPLFMPIGAMANLFDMTKHLTMVNRNNIVGDLMDGEDTLPEVAELAVSLIFAMSKTLQDKAYFQGIANLLEGLQTDDPRQLAKLTSIIENMGASFVPIAPLQVTEGATRASIALGLGGEYPELSEAVGFIDKIQRRLPSYIDNLPPKYNWLTGEIIKNPDALSSGFPMVPDKTTELVGSELVRLNYPFKGPPRRIQQVLLNSEQYSDFNQLMGNIRDPKTGRNLMQTLEAVMRDPQYRRNEESAYDGQIQTREIQVVSKVLSAYRKAAKLKVFEKYPELSSEVTNRKINNRAGTRLKETNR